jgi:YkoY family integral membrane protein
MMELLHHFLGEDLQTAGAVILNLIIIESLLSVDNAAVLATMVMDLPKEERNRALKYGIIGAYAFRGLCLFFASFLLKFWWLKPLGGMYLFYLTYDYFMSKTRSKSEEEEDALNKEDKWFYRKTVGRVGKFWSTVIAVEIMDLAFSIDNVFAAVAYTDNINLVYIGVFIGILAMRFVAQLFVRLLERFPFLETVAFVVIGVLGIKLYASLFSHFYPHSTFGKAIESEHADTALSVFTVLIFFVPILTSYLFNFPKKNTAAE